MDHYLKLNTHFLTVPYQGRQRRIRVLLPKNYEESQEAYPVVYMQDGQNVFYSRESFSGYSWKVIPTVKRQNLTDMIIVGIDNDGHNRINEYSFWPITNTPMPFPIALGGQGQDYADFLVNVVKPFVDKQYRTKPEKKYTALIGSSMGANISATTGIIYSHIFGNLGIFSLATWLTKDDFDIALNTIEDTDQKIFIQVGTDEGDDTDRKLMFGNMAQTYIDTSLNYYNHLLKKGFSLEQVKLVMMAGGKHSETMWAAYLPDCLRFFSKEW